MAINSEIFADLEATSRKKYEWVVVWSREGQWPSVRNTTIHLRRLFTCLHFIACTFLAHGLFSVITVKVECHVNDTPISDVRSKHHHLSSL